MASKVHYFALGFGQPGFIPNGSQAFAVSTRAEVRDAIASQFYGENADTEASKALRDFGLRDAWAWAKRSGFSCYHREINFGGSEILNFMGLTEDEYNSQADNDF